MQSTEGGVVAETESNRDEVTRRARPAIAKALFLGMAVTVALALPLIEGEGAAYAQSPSGGNGGASGGNGGAGGSGYDGTGTGGNGQSVATGGGGGGGGGGAGGALGGSGGTSASDGSGGAGGAGGTNGYVGSAAGFPTSGSVNGGAGGPGAAGGYGGSRGSGDGGGGGGGGEGGYGAVINSTGSLTIGSSQTISGGNGGNGGNGGSGGSGVVGAGGDGGNGGDGGIGILFTQTGVTLNNSGTISGGNGGTGGAAGGPFTFTPAGAAGSGGVGVEGAGLTVIDSGTISGGLSGDGVTRADAILFTGGSNTLQLQAGYNIIGNVVGTGSDAFQLGGSGSGSFNLSSFGGTQQYQGFASFSVVGGNWTLTGANTTAVPFSVSNATATIDGTFDDSSATVNAGGVLVVNGRLNDPTVNAGGTLTGTGTVGDTQINSGGTFVPGNGTPGSSMTISGNLAFQSGALYVVYLNPTTSSYATVTGTAALAGTVEANFASGSYVAKQYTILTATNGVSGTFSAISNVNLPAGASDYLSYDANDVYLNLVPGFTSYTGLSGNQQNVANALTNFFNTTGGIPAQFFSLAPGGLAQVDGEAATGAERGAFQLMTEFLGLMLDPFVAGRAGGGLSGGSAGAIGFAPEEQTTLPNDLALAYAGVLKAPPQPTFDQRWSAWGGAYGGSSTASGEAAVGSNTVSTRTYGSAAGLDYHVDPRTVVGFALAGGGTNWGLANGLGTGRSDAFQVGIYSVTWRGPLYFAGALAFTNHWFTTDRSALGDQLTANFSGQSYGGRLETGYRYIANPLPTVVVGVTPYAAVQVQDFHTPNYREGDTTGGGFGLSYAAMNATDTRTELGGRFDAPTLLCGLPLILRSKLAWAHDFVSNPSLSAAFESLPGASFTVNGAPIPRDSALVSAGAQLFITPSWSLLAKFDGEFADGAQTYAGTGTLRYAW